LLMILNLFSVNWEHCHNVVSTTAQLTEEKWAHSGWLLTLLSVSPVESKELTWGSKRGRFPTEWCYVGSYEVHPEHVRTQTQTGQ
jgi:hypothetical protein